MPCSNPPRCSLLALHHPAPRTACRPLAWLVGCALLLGLASAAPAQTRLIDVCRVKGQEENELVGMGLVVGLRGTGDSTKFLPTIRSLAATLQLMEHPLGSGGLGEIQDAKNVALVMVSATVPAGGARDGDRLTCRVSSIGSAKSLAGGRLFVTPLQDVQPGNNKVYAFAQGDLKVDPTNANTATVYNGCRLVEDFFNPYVKDGRITLVINPNQASFIMAQEIADLVNEQFSSQQSTPYGTQYVRPAMAINQVNVMVGIPPQYQRFPVEFVAQIMNLPLDEIRTDARVVVNERTGSVVISGDVEIGPAVVTHRNIVVETGAFLGDPFVGVDPEKANPTQLKALLEALNAVKVPTEDMIEILKGLERNGKLRGRLIIE